MLMTLLRVAVESSAEPSDDAGVPFGDDILGYFLASLPFASSLKSYHNLLKEAKVNMQWWPSLSHEDGEEDVGVPKVNIELFGTWKEDSCTPLLIISFIFMMLDSYRGDTREREMLFALLAQLASVYPNQCASAVVHYLVNPRSEWLLNNLIMTETSVESAEITSTVHNLFQLAMASHAWSTTASSAGAKGDTSSESRRTHHYKALEELDMHSLAGTWQFATEGRALELLHWVPQLVNAIIDKDR